MDKYWFMYLDQISFYFEKLNILKPFHHFTCIYSCKLHCHFWYMTMFSINFLFEYIQKKRLSIILYVDCMESLFVNNPSIYHSLKTNICEELLKNNRLINLLKSLGLINLAFSSFFDITLK